MVTNVNVFSLITGVFKKKKKKIHKKYKCCTVFLKRSQARIVEKCPETLIVKKCKTEKKRLKGEVSETPAVIW